MNTVILSGRTTRDIELRQANSGKMLARFTLAVDRRVRDEADFINCIAFDKTAETLELYAKKGTKLNVVGHIQTGSYDGNDGKKVFTFDVIIDSWEFCESRKAAQEARPSPTAAQIDEANETMGFKPADAAAHQEAQAAYDESEDLPF